MNSQNSFSNAVAVKVGTPAISVLYILESAHEENHLAAYTPTNPRASSDTVRLLAKLDEIEVESLRAKNFEERGSEDE